MSTALVIVGFAFLVVFIVGVVAFKTVIDGLYSIGVQQGYQPKQPIAFSHKVHAGQYEIECKYCHTGAARGKQASIPSTNICMNCHSVAKKDQPEIVKLRDYYESGKPIEWNRVHKVAHKVLEVGCWLVARAVRLKTLHRF